MRSTAEVRCAIFPPATLPLVSRTKVRVSGIDSSAIPSMVWTTPLSRSSKSAAFNPVTIRLPSVTSASTRTTSTPLRNFCPCAPAEMTASGGQHRREPHDRAILRSALR